MLRLLLLLAAIGTALPALAAEKAPPLRVAAKPSTKAPVPEPPPTLRVGIEGAFPPFSEVDPKGELRGFDVDVARALCEELRERCQLVRQGWEELQTGLIAHETDLIVASLSITDLRRERFAFTDKYYQVPTKFVARRGANLSFEPAALRGTRVGVQTNTVQAQLLPDFFAEVLQPIYYPTLPSALEALARGEVPLVVGNALALDLGFLKTPEGQDYEFVGPSLNDTERFGQGTGIALRKEDTALRERLNAAIRRLRADGRYQGIAGRYFAFDLYGDALEPNRPKRGAAGTARPPERGLPRLIDGTVGGRGD